LENNFVFKERCIYFGERERESTSGVSEGQGEREKERSRHPTEHRA